MVKVRYNSYQDKVVLTALEQKADEWEKLLNRNCIFPTDVFVWIKEFKGQYYLKIEIDACGQELQYEISYSTGVNQLNVYTIHEVHFKNFLKKNGNFVREDLTKQTASPTIRAIDDLIREYEEELTKTK